MVKTYAELLVKEAIKTGATIPGRIKVLVQGKTYWVEVTEEMAKSLTEKTAATEAWMGSPGQICRSCGGTGRV